MGSHDCQRPGASVVRVRMAGPLASFAGAFGEVLADHGYSPRSSGELLRLAGKLSWWMAGRDLAAGDLTAADVEEFARERRAEVCPKWVTSRSLWPMLACLPVTASELVSGVPVTGLLASYRDYLLAERGLAASTVAQYLRLATAFLAWLPGGERAWRAWRPGWRGARLPVPLKREQVMAVLGACDRGTGLGARRGGRLLTRRAFETSWLDFLTSDGSASRVAPAP